MSTRALLPDEQRAFRLARLNAGERMPYFLHGIFAARPLAAPGLGTFAVDKAWRLYVDPDLLTGENAWSPQVSGAVLLHEVSHLLRDHAGRAHALPAPLDHQAWNLACDAEINDDLLAAGLSLPGGVITPDALGHPDGGLAEDYYTATAEPEGARAPTPGCGSGAGQIPHPVELSEADTATEPGLSEPAGDLVRRAVAQAVQAHQQSKGRGTVPAGLDRWARDVLRPPTVSWSRMLRAALRRAIANTAGRTDYTYTRPARRRLPGIVKPAMRGPKITAAVVIDTSASMNADDLHAALSELDGVLRASGIDREHVTALACDANTTEPQRLRSVHDVHLAGGGGTDMRIGIHAALTAHPHVVIVLTDGGTPWPQAPIPALLICAIISATPPEGTTPAWATTVHIPTGDHQ